ncbi:hypothetical protein [Streptomyces sp. NPDC049881]|uniref:hypothetical protein n=1 Tax=Streptomyces sp. NPDC049881 TaxID=3155778 RepID=UPI003424C05B
MNDNTPFRPATGRAGPAVLLGFLLLLGAVFLTAYAVGTAVGPVAPDLRPVGDNAPRDGSPHGGH